jgi:hypothetical protein
MRQRKRRKAKIAFKEFAASTSWQMNYRVSGLIVICRIIQAPTTSEFRHSQGPRVRIGAASVRLQVAAQQLRAFTTRKDMTLMNIRIADDQAKQRFGPFEHG